MTMLSRDIGRWLASCPGHVTGKSEEEVWALARLSYLRFRRVKPENCPLELFVKFVMNCGYKTETRIQHDNGALTVMLALPSPPIQRRRMVRNG